MRMRLVVSRVLALSLLILVLVIAAGSAAISSGDGGIVGTNSNAVFAANTLTVNGYSQDGKVLNMWIAIQQQQNGAIAKAGFTPLTFVGVPGGTYLVIASDYDAGGIFFDRWGNGATNKARSVTLGSSDIWIDAYYRTGQAPTTPLTHTLTVKSTDLNGKAISGYYTVIASAGGATVRTGFTPLSFSVVAGTTYTVTPGDYNSGVFDHWENGSTARTRSISLNSETTITAYYRGLAAPTPSPTPPGGISSLIPKTGVFVALYMYPGGTGTAHWQKVIDEKVKHPSVPVVAVFNPDSGPGNARDSNIAGWVVKLRNAGVIAIGYTYDDYGTRSLSSLRGDADKYRNWYGADGLFIDEFTNRAGYENHYRDATAYAKSIGMKMTMGNPGTDVPRSYIGTVDVINITEGVGYMPISWLQYCIGCSGSGWHDDYDKRNFAYIRYDIGWLDTAFVTESSKWVGLLYITNGNDSNSRWFHLPPYYSTLMSTLDR